ncbi:MAG TPA: class I SAM-dependent methyltransferase [Gemmataceae bacterium]|jgi:ubiquinone/menaquinone biosynthesis C-methylase UbiE
MGKNDTSPTAQQPDYGIDGPRGVILLVVVFAVSVNVAGLLHGWQDFSSWGTVLAQVALLVLAVDCLFLAGSLLWYSKVQKLRERERLLNLVPWRGDERVLDVGCGRGLLLIGAAQRLKSGRAVGVDLWRGLELSGNRPEATLENARRAGVAERVEVQDSDARQLPFADASFDVVVSSLVLHNIPGQEGRRQAVREIARVLKPGGHVALLDMRHTLDYAHVLRDCGLVDAQRQSAGWFLSVLFPLLSCGAVYFSRVTARKLLSEPRPLGSGQASAP